MCWPCARALAGALIDETTASRNPRTALLIRLSKGGNVGYTFFRLMHTPIEHFYHLKNILALVNVHHVIIRKYLLGQSVCFLNELIYICIRRFIAISVNMKVALAQLLVVETRNA